MSFIIITEICKNRLLCRLSHYAIERSKLLCLRLRLCSFDSTVGELPSQGQKQGILRELPHAGTLLYIQKIVLFLLNSTAPIGLMYVKYKPIGQNNLSLTYTIINLFLYIGKSGGTHFKSQLLKHYLWTSDKPLGNKYVSGRSNIILLNNFEFY